MGSLSPKPTIVIVPGSFSPVPFYADIITQLTKDGYPALTVPIPSIGRRDPLPPATMADDASYIQSIIAPLAEEGKDIIMVTHSYGGICGTESLKGLTTTERQKEGKTGGISRVLYITSIVPKMEMSLKDMMGDLVPTYLHVEVRSIAPFQLHTLSLIVDPEIGRLHDARFRPVSLHNILGPPGGQGAEMGDGYAGAFNCLFRRKGYAPGVQGRGCVVHVL